MSLFPSVCTSVCLSIGHASYFRNHTSSDHKFWHTYLRWWYIVAFFFIFFLILIFWAVRRVKGQKVAQNELHLSHVISQEQYSIWSWFLVQLCKMILSPGIFFFFFLILIFLGFLIFWFWFSFPKMKNNCIRHTPYLRNSMAYDHDFWYTIVKW